MSAFKVVLKQSGITLDVPEDKSLLEVLLAAGLPMGWRCREGYCGNCGVRVLEGTPEHFDEVMVPWERAQNKLMMSCVSRCIGEQLVLDL
ncbi:MAG TPA: 2Fe-2S iron-sulfur cluster binding domain-containing protein [Alphaproteobacteria bacterium]|nr:2Fe-2S iron-sulfur cluster binding domain-containing protein [Alphaproteobacteria bacterium]